MIHERNAYIGTHWNAVALVKILLESWMHVGSLREELMASNIVEWSALKGTEHPIRAFTKSISSCAFQRTSGRFTIAKVTFSNPAMDFENGVNHWEFGG